MHGAEPQLAHLWHASSAARRWAFQQLWARHHTPKRRTTCIGKKGQAMDYALRPVSSFGLTVFNTVQRQGLDMTATLNNQLSRAL